MTKIPAGCRTPNRDRNHYTLTKADIDFMTEAVRRVNEMLSYYINMPENETGELRITDANCCRLEDLIDDMDEARTALMEVTWT